MIKRLLLILLILVSSNVIYGQSRHISKRTKEYVYARDSAKCRCCGDTIRLEYDHIQPFSKGGLNDTSNIQLLCRPCNRSKSNNDSCRIHVRLLNYNRLYNDTVKTTVK